MIILLKGYCVADIPILEIFKNINIQNLTTFQYPSLVDCKFIWQDHVFQDDIFHIVFIMPFGSKI